MSKILKFIKENNIDFDGEGSGLNSNCVIISGYALHLDLDFEELADELDDEIGLSNDAALELERVFDYAYINSYENFWTTPEAKKMYKF